MPMTHLIGRLSIPKGRVSMKGIFSYNNKTIQTILIRLENKGVIAHEKDSRMFAYFPLIKKEEYPDIP